MKENLKDGLGVVVLFATFYAWWMLIAAVEAGA